MLRGQRQELLQLPLNENQRQRLIDAYAEGPLLYKPEIDDELISRGWLCFYEYIDNRKSDAVEPRAESRWFYNKNGSIHNWLYE